ncbi:unnamed protein product [Phaedon cochleariae]|uniref:Uncharacterized protein n=1 Tax=Phaedon cochleariae TaxID=80249 RepID=A0A9N9SAP4_PHACE|nr:unnamed protein product [Phaedon cochleariae]
MILDLVNLEFNQFQQEQQHSLAATDNEAAAATAVTLAAAATSQAWYQFNNDSETPNILFYSRDDESEWKSLFYPLPPRLQMILDQPVSARTAALSSSNRG